ncbi:MAG: hypothetical protein IJA20_05020 [Methanocorpusculum sp.]|nr:hypothetical protein [Methanocorpusculum sp.]
MFLKETGDAFFQKDIERSQEIYKKYAKLIEQKRCYENTLRLVLDTPVMQNAPELLVAYGAKESAQAGIFVRHAFFYDKSTGMVLDPTIPEKREPDERYIIAEAFSFNEYLDAILNGGKTTDFWDNKVFRKYLQEMERWTLAQGFAIVG